MAGKRAGVAAVVITAGLLGVGCATAPWQNYDKVSLGMTPDQVLSAAGTPNRMYQMESTGQGTVIPTPAGRTETWFYKSGLVQFHDGKVVAKGHKVP
jgi:hypothetical protein